MSLVRRFWLFGGLVITNLASSNTALWAEDAPKRESAKQNYDDIFQDGLKAEADQKWADAIQFYVLAMAKNPKSPWPKERLKALFQKLQKEEISIVPYESLLSPELRDEFLKTGVIRTAYDSEKGAQDLNRYIWSAVVGGILLIGIVLIILMIKSRGSEREAERLQTAMRKDRRQTPRAPSSTGAIAKPEFATGPAPTVLPETKSIKRPEMAKKEVKLNEGARANITGVVANVKSLNLDEKKIDELTGARRVDLAGLSDSGVINALVEDWVTEVKIEQTDKGKFSKMTVDASLVFDDNIDQGSGKI